MTGIVGEIEKCTGCIQRGLTEGRTIRSEGDEALKAEAAVAVVKRMVPLRGKTQRQLEVNALQHTIPERHQAVSPCQNLTSVDKE